MNMKKILTWGMMLAAAFTLTNCAEEIDNPNQQPEINGIPFEIVASAVDTKTQNDGVSTNWVANDNINLFHAVSGSTTYVNDGEFNISEEDLEANRFRGTLNTGENGLTEEAYDWYAFYPYHKNVTTPKNTSNHYFEVGCKASSNQTQAGNNSMTHIAGAYYPIAGKASAVSATSIPEIVMSHVSSLLEVVVKNDSSEPVAVEEIMVSASELLVGTFYIDFSGEIVPASFKSSGDGYTSKTATLKVTDGESIAVGGTAKFYLAVKPFVAATGTELTIVVNGECKKTIEMPKDITFAAGKIRTLNFSYTGSNISGAEAITVAEFSEKDDDATTVYELTGRVTDIYEEYSSFGNMSYYLTDATGTVLIFRMDCDESVGTALTIGDEVTVQGTKTTYNTSPQMNKGGKYVSHRDGCAPPKFSFADNTVTITAAEGETIYYTLDEDTPTIKYDSPIVITENVTVTAIATAEGLLSSLPATEDFIWASPDAPKSVTATLTFDDKSKRTEYSTLIQVWTENGITLTNEKADATTNVGDYYKPARFYKGSKIYVEAPGNIMNIVFNCNNSEYATALNTSITNSSKSGNDVTVTLDGNSTKSPEYQMSAKVFVNSVTVTYMSGEGGGDEPQPELVKLATPNVECVAGETTENTLRFSWEAIENASNYKVVFNGTETEQESTEYTATDLTADTEYTISVIALGDDVNFTNSDAGTATAKTSAASQGGGDEPVENYVAVINVDNINAIKVMGNGSYGDYKDKDVSITVDGLPCIARNICANSKDGNLKMAAKQFIQIKATTGYIYNAGGKVKSIKVWTHPSKDKGDFIYTGSSFNPTNKVTLSKTTEAVQLKDNNDNTVSTTLNVYEVNLDDNNSYFNIKSSSAIWIYKLEVTYAN